MKNHPILKCLLILMMIVGLEASQPSASAANYSWTNTANTANFSSSGVWSTNGTPGIADTVNFTNNLAYTVQFTSGVTNKQANFNGGTVTLAITGNTWTLQTNAAIGFSIANTTSTTATVYFVGGTLVVTNNGESLQIGTGVLGSGTFYITNGTVLATNTYLGGTSSGSGTLVLSGSGTVYTNYGLFYVGQASGSSSNSLVVSNTAILNALGGLTFGKNSGNNLLIVTNAMVLTGGSVTIGSGSSSNIVNVYTNAVWNFGGQTLNLGSGGATGNVLAINGGIVTNIAYLNIGVGASGNSLTISNGGQLLNVSILLGTSGGGNNNSFNLGGFGAASTVSNSGITVGSASCGFNTLTASNAMIVCSGSLIIGNGGSNNTMNVYSNTVWNVTIGHTVQIGSGSATGNVMIINGGIVNAISSYGTLGTGGASGNSLTVSNGGQFLGLASLVVGSSSSNNTFNVGGLGVSSTVSNGTLTIGSSGGFNMMTVTNAQLWSGTTTIGNGASNNAVMIQAASWNLLGNNLTIGANAALGNVLTLNTGSITNVGTLTIGSGVVPACRYGLRPLPLWATSVL